MVRPDPLCRVPGVASRTRTLRRPLEDRPRCLLLPKYGGKILTIDRKAKTKARNCLRIRPRPHRNTRSPQVLLHLHVGSNQMVVLLAYPPTSKVQDLLCPRGRAVIQRDCRHNTCIDVLLSGPVRVSSGLAGNTSALDAGPIEPHRVIYPRLEIYSPGNAVCYI